jgi:hypothetical protein
MRSNNKKIFHAERLKGLGIGQPEKDRLYSKVLIGASTVCGI